MRPTGPWASGLSAFVASALIGWVFEGVGICGGSVFVKGVQLTKEEGPAIILGVQDSG
jgi:hypothetical protein